MKKILIIIVFLLSATNALADATINAASCSRADIVTALTTASASSGVVTVNIPSCDSTTHTSAITINMSTGYANVTSLIISGVNKTGTILNNSGWVVTVPAAKKFRMTSMTLTGIRSGTGIGMITLAGGTNPAAGGGFRLDNLIMNGSGSRAVFVNGGYTYGLIDSITSSWNGQWSLVRGNISSTDGGNTVWAEAETFGASNAVYLENCTLTNTDPSYLWMVMDHDYGAKVVVRYNTLNRYHFGGHDATLGGGRSNRHWEVYNNYFTTDANWGADSFVLRGGTGRIYNNTTYSSASLTPYGHGSQIYVRNKRSTQNGDADPWVNRCDTTAEKMCVSGTKPKNCSTDADCGGGAGSCQQIDDNAGYPCRDQLGRGQNQALVPVLFWNNKTIFYNESVVVTTPAIETGHDHIQANRDFCSHATTMPATCNGVETDYTPYTCPHPLAGEGACDYNVAGTAGYSLGLAPDETPPVISAPTPTGQQACTGDDEEVEIGVTTDEAATCKYDTSDTTYALMANTFSSTGGTTHTQTVTSDCSSSPLYYVRCMDAAENVNTVSAQITYQMASDEDTTPLTIESASLAADGRTLTMTASEAAAYGAGGYEGLALSSDGGEVTASFVSIVGATITFYTSRIILGTETLTWTYTQPGNGIEDLAGNDMATVGDAQAITNNSTQEAEAGSGGAMFADYTVVELQHAGSPAEFGMKVTTTAAIKVTEVCFYKSETNTGTHVVNVWNASGVNLATQTVVDETASGWQCQAFDTPAEVLADDTFIVSYYSPTGIVDYKHSFFLSPWVVGAYTADSGTYAYGSSTRFPNATTATTHFVDFKATSGYEVTPSLTGTGATISQSRVGLADEQPTVTVTLRSGHRVNSVTGTCGGSGSLSGYTYTYTPTALSADCTVEVEVEAIPLLN